MLNRESYRFQEGLLLFRAQLLSRNSAYTSLYSDSLAWRVHPEYLKSAEGCLLTLIGFQVFGAGNLTLMEYLPKIGKIVEKRQEEGKWAEVKRLLDLTAQGSNILIFVLYWLSSFSSQEFFSRERQLSQWLRRLRVVDPYAPKRTRVRKPQRKRGYNDKGTLDPVHAEEQKARKEANLGTYEFKVQRDYTKDLSKEGWIGTKLAGWDSGAHRVRRNPGAEAFFDWFNARREGTQEDTQQGRA